MNNTHTHTHTHTHTQRRREKQKESQAMSSASSHTSDIHHFHPELDMGKFWKWVTTGYGKKLFSSKTSVSPEEREGMPKPSHSLGEVCDKVCKR